MGLHHRLEIYVGFDFPSINKYLETHMRDTVKASPKDCEFNESIFPALGNDLLQSKVEHKISWTTSTLSHLDPRTRQNDEEIMQILHIQELCSPVLGHFY